MSNCSYGNEILDSLRCRDPSRINEIIEWIEQRKTFNQTNVEKVNLRKLSQWREDLDTGNFVHQSGKFFSISGLRALDEYNNVLWSQPIIIQPEIGILGILSRLTEGVRYFLMQAKAEPGNIGGVQISPTVQATKSNYTAVHSGVLPLYLEYFLGQKQVVELSKLELSEQGSRFYKKKNINTVIDVSEDVDCHEDFFWMTLGEIKSLMKIDNLINMDTRTVLSTILYEPFLGLSDDHFNDVDRAYFNSCAMQNLNDEHITQWLKLQKSDVTKSELTSLNTLADWKITADGELGHAKCHYFKIVGVKVSAVGREVGSWDQPLISSSGEIGLLGLIVSNLNGKLQILLQAKMEIGNQDLIEIAPTISLSNYLTRIDDNQVIPFLNYFIEKSESKILFDNKQSEEGGRFYHVENRNIIVLVEKVEADIPSNYRWFSLSEVAYLQKQGKINSDTRTLLSCFPLCETVL